MLKMKMNYQRTCVWNAAATVLRELVVVATILILGLTNIGAGTNRFHTIAASAENYDDFCS